MNYKDLYVTNQHLWAQARVKAHVSANHSQWIWVKIKMVIVGFGAEKALWEDPGVALIRCTLTFRSFSWALLLVRLTSMVRLFLGTAIHRIPSRTPGGCSRLCCSSSSSSLFSWGRRLGPFTASAGATTHSKDTVTFLSMQPKSIS